MSKRHDPVEAIFNAAIEFSGPERELYLARACGNDASLRQRVEKLLRALEKVGGFLGDAEGEVLGPALTPSGETHATCLMPVTEQAGERIGRYKLLERLGEGGCGVVYVAAQEEPVRRRVALKVIKLGMDTKSVLARFEAERQALALMDHPNIAKVFDAGATETGRPFFVMELVRGLRITDYCDQNNLPTHKRLELFIHVCHAIQHAHQKGIIHRDIKPSNILVTLHDGVPVPKVIDFGIAKATEGRLTDATLYTQLHQFIGTPAYMSPRTSGDERFGHGHPFGYGGIPGVLVSDLTNHHKFPDQPDSIEPIGRFEIPSDRADYYGARLTGYLIPAVTGDYVFYLASDDESRLYLSSNEDAGQMRAVAWEVVSAPRQWRRQESSQSNEPGNVSSPVPLEAGRRYYVEVLYKQDLSRDFLAVAWQLPGEPPPGLGAPPIPGRYLAYDDSGKAELKITAQPGDQSVLEYRTATFSVQATGRDSLGGPILLYQWQTAPAGGEEFTNIAGATQATYTTPAVMLADDGRQRECVPGLLE